MLREIDSRMEDSALLWYDFFSTTLSDLGFKLGVFNYLLNTPSFILRTEYSFAQKGLLSSFDSILIGLKFTQNLTKYILIYIFIDHINNFYNSLLYYHYLWKFN